MSEVVTAEQLSEEVVRSRDAIAALARRCGREEWHAAPLAGDGREVGVVIDHVSDSYRYLGNWVRQLLGGEVLAVDGDIVDALNARHAGESANVTVEQAVAHLGERGDAFAALIRPLAVADLDIGDGRVRRFAQIAIRHADDHRAEIEAALAAGTPTAAHLPG